MKRICSVCGSARTSVHNRVYLSAYLSIMESGEGWNDESSPSWPPRLLTAMAGLATTMAWSQDWYRASGFEQMGAATVEEFLKRAEDFFSDWVPADTYHQTLTWMAADVSAHPDFDGDLNEALGAKALILPCDTDMYFRVADNEAEIAAMPNAELKVIHSSWGHVAGLPGANPKDDAFIDAALTELLASDYSPSPATARETDIPPDAWSPRTPIRPTRSAYHQYADQPLTKVRTTPPLEAEPYGNTRT